MKNLLFAFTRRRSLCTSRFSPSEGRRDFGSTGKCHHLC